MDYKCLLLLLVVVSSCVRGENPNAAPKNDADSDPQPARIDMNCSPTDKYGDCPPGYCCVRDEFLPSDVFCKRIGGNGDHCTTRNSYSDCPCAPGYGCKPNIISAEFASLYGVCTLNYKSLQE